MTEVGGQKTEIGSRKWEKRTVLKSEVGPVAVPEGRDYAAASMRKSEKKEGGKFRN